MTLYHNATKTAFTSVKGLYPTSHAVANKITQVNEPRNRVMAERSQSKGPRGFRHPVSGDRMARSEGSGSCVITNQLKSTQFGLDAQGVYFPAVYELIKSVPGIKIKDWEYQW